MDTDKPWKVKVKVEKGINFIFCLGTAYDVSIMESVGMLQVVFVGGMDRPPKMFLPLFFRFEL